MGHARSYAYINTKLSIRVKVLSVASTRRWCLCFAACAVKKEVLHCDGRDSSCTVHPPTGDERYCSPVAERTVRTETHSFAAIVALADGENTLLARAMNQAKKRTRPKRPLNSSRLLPAASFGTISRASFWNTHRCVFGTDRMLTVA